MALYPWPSLGTVEAADEERAVEATAKEFGDQARGQLQNRSHQGPPTGAALIDWLINFILYIVGILVIASMFGGFIKLYERGRSIVMFFINMPRHTQVFIAEAKKRLLPDNKIPTSKTTRDD